MCRYLGVAKQYALHALTRKVGNNESRFYKGSCVIFNSLINTVAAVKQTVIVIGYELSVMSASYSNRNQNIFFYQLKSAIHLYIWQNVAGTHHS